MRITTIVSTLSFMVAFAVAARADVFNMPSGQTSVTMVAVGNPSNAPDAATGNLCGSAGYCPERDLTYCLY